MPKRERAYGRRAIIPRVPQRRLTNASSLTAARLRFLLKPNGYGGAAATEAEALGTTSDNHIRLLTRRRGL